VTGVRRIVRAAAYRPIWTEGGRRVGGPDEDRFTFLAAALEAATEGGFTDSRPVAVHVLGTDPSPPGSFAALLGRPAEVVADASSRPSLQQALSTGRDGDGPLVIVTTGSVDDEGGAEGSPSAGVASLAIYLDDRNSPAAGEGIPLDAFPSDGSPVLAAFAAWRKTRRGANDPRWVGDWNGGSRDVRPLPPQKSDEEPLGRVSQGAYLPPARYEESLPSRWGFLADRCGACGFTTFPQSGRCRGCGRSDRLSPVPLPKGGGRVLAETWIGSGGQPTEFDPEVERAGPYGVVLVELAPGLRATLMVADADRGSVPIGSTVVTQLRRLYALEGAWRYGRKAIPTVPRPHPK
jgi:uncharacterized OB-fold protein